MFFLHFFWHVLKSFQKKKVPMRFSHAFFKDFFVVIGNLKKYIDLLNYNV